MLPVTALYKKPPLVLPYYRKKVNSEADRWDKTTNSKTGLHACIVSCETLLCRTGTVDSATTVIKTTIIY